MNTLKALAILLLFSANSFFGYAQPVSLKNTLPKAGKLVDDKPVGKGWTNLLESADAWNFESAYWQLSNNVLHASGANEKEHHYSYTKKTYADFELNVMIKM